MCGRYARRSDKQRIAEHFHANPSPPDLPMPAADYTFLEPKDFSDLRSSAFAGIAEWDSFAEHVLGCTRCGEV